jgi:hypothetical protein
MHRSLLGLGLVPLLLGLTSCSLSQNPDSTSSLLAPARSPAVSASPVPAPPELMKSELAQPELAQSELAQSEFAQSELAQSESAQPEPEAIQSESAQLESAQPAASQPSLNQDYGSTTPLPQTGQVTIRNDIRNLDLNQLIAPCPSDSSPYAFAESTNYRVQICSAEYDPWQPKYYIGQAKENREELTITSTDPAAARQLVFKHAGYTYVLYRDGRTVASNAYLQVFTPSGEGYAEALLYFYETSPLQMR